MPFWPSTTRSEYRDNCSGNLTQLYTTMHSTSFGLTMQEREDWPSTWSRTRKTAFMASEVGMPYQGQFRYFTYVLAGQRLFVEHAARHFVYQTVAGGTPEVYTERFLTDGSLNPVVLAIRSFVARQHIRAWRSYDISGLGIFGEEGFCFPVNRANQRFPVDWKHRKTWGIKPASASSSHGFAGSGALGRASKWRSTRACAVTRQRDALRS